jgi:hypothetical protein
METERVEVRIPRGARIGPASEPIYGYETVKAESCAGLAVHKAVGHKPRWRWMVTHVASGMSLENLGGPTKAVAADNMRRALTLDFDWTQGEVETLAALRDRRDIVDAVRAIGNRD